MLLKILYIIIVIHLFCNIAISQEEGYSFHELSTEDGLSQSDVNDILRDEDGFLWIAVPNGINRYDGHYMQLYQPAKGQKSFNSRINQLFLDSRNTLWAISDTELGMYDRLEDELVNSAYLTEQAVMLEHVEGCTELPNGDIFFCASSGLHIFNYDSAKFTKIDVDAPEGFPYYKIYQTEVLTKDKVLLTSTNHLFELDLRSYKVRYLCTYNVKNTTSDLRTGVKKTLREPNGYFWLFTYDSKLLRYDYPNNSIKEFSMLGKNFSDAFQETDSTILISIETHWLCQALKTRN